MRAVAATLAAVGVVLSASLAYSQQQPKKMSASVPQDALREIAYLLGNWTMQGESDQGKLVSKYSTKWAPGKHACISNSSWSTPAGKSLGLGVTGWDGATRQITTVEFYTDGFSHILRYRIKSPSVWEGEANGVDQDGKVFKRKIRVEKNGKDEFKWIRFDKDGAEPELVLHFRRAVAAGEPTAEHYVNFFKPFVGDWETVGEVGGQTSKGIWSFKLSPGGRYFVSHGTVEGQDDNDGLHGYDPKSKRLKHVGWNREGDHTVGYTRIDAKTLKRGPVGATWKGESQGVTADGKSISNSSTTTVIDKNTLSFRVTNILRDGERQPDLAITLKRAKTNQKPGSQKPGDKTVGQPDNLLDQFGKLMAGRWIGDVTLIANWPGIGKQGDKVTTYMTIGWIADKNALEEQWHGGKGTGKSIYLWDAASKQIRIHGVDSGGTTAHSLVSKKGDKWVWTGGGSLSDGTKFRGEGTLTVKDGGNTLIYTGTSFMDGKKLLDLHDVYKRLSK